ncbi:MAG: response regulator, partial [Bacteroidia bacterium]
MSAFLSRKYRVYIVDDHQIMIDGITALLKNSPDFEIVGQQTNPLLAIEDIKTKKADILISDISMKEMTGIDLAKRMHMEMPGLKILALSMYGDRETISEMLEAGIHGYLLKNTGTDELVAALTKLANGNNFFSDEVTAEIMKYMSQPKVAEQKETVTLTAREIEIVKLIAEEFSNAQ